ncbi:MAG: UTP--glucose-1-phosphate uridylyltransferase [Acidobacteriota bacterium]|nr:UTP--glucose-1-phosphate uridylyltransferase [Acidobacteriota bacterium]
MKVKGVIVAAGYGSRFLPVTKTVPKEMLPLIDRPAIQFIIDEFLEAGIEEILIITSRRKKVLDDYFDREAEMEALYRSEGKLERLEKIRPPKARIFFVRQQEMRGTGHALLEAEPFTGNDPFIVAYPDDIVFCEHAGLSKQLVAVYRQHGKSILAVKNLHDKDVSRYGVVDPGDQNNPCSVRRLVEKPPAGEEPSKLVSYGRYLFTPEFYEYLHRAWETHLNGPDPAGEFYHVNGINLLAAEGGMTAYDFKGERLDTGEPLGFLEAVCRYALQREDLKQEARVLFNKLASL